MVVILHLKCSTKDLQTDEYQISNFNYKPEINPIEGFNIVDKPHHMSDYNPKKEFKSKSKFAEEKEKENQKEKKYNKKYNHSNLQLFVF